MSVRRTICLKAADSQADKSACEREGNKAEHQYEDFSLKLKKVKTEPSTWLPLFSNLSKLRESQESSSYLLSTAVTCQLLTECQM